MKLNIYVCKDTISTETICTFSSITDGQAVRDNAIYLKRMHPLTDLLIYQVAELDSQTLELKAVPLRQVSWDSYKFPENPMIPKGVTIPETPKKQTKEKETK